MDFASVVAVTRVYANSAARINITAVHVNAEANAQRRCLRRSHSRRRRSAASEIFATALPRAAIHSRKTRKAAAPRMTVKKNTSLRTIGPFHAISTLLDGSHIA